MELWISDLGMQRAIIDSRVAMMLQCPSSSAVEEG